MPINPYSLSASVPRSVPPALRVRLLVASGPALIFWGVLGFGMIFFWAFSVDRSIADLWNFRGEVASTPGVVTGWRNTNISINDVNVHATQYRYTAYDIPHTGESYATGRHLDSGAAVTVEFVRANPACSRIRGMDSSPMGYFALIILPFPAASIPFFIYGFLKGRRAVRLLRWGELATGTLKSKQPTNVRINKRTVYKLTFAFRASDGAEYEAVAKTHLPEKLEDEKQEPLLYLSEAPSKAVMLDALPGNPRIDETGTIRAQLTAGAAFALLLPVGVIAVHGFVAYLRYAR